MDIKPGNQSGADRAISIHQAIILVAICYFALGRAALLLAIPPGYATAVWPSAGIALAAVLLAGPRVWPGILLGSILTNLDPITLTLTPQGILNSLAPLTGIGLGAALQAVVAGHLLKRFQAFSAQLQEEKEILKFLLIAGPAACLISPTAGMVSLFAAGTVAVHELPFNWLTWWIGDTVGAILFTPLVFVVLGRPRDPWKGRRKTVGIPLLVVIGLAVSGYTVTSNWEQEKIKGQFQIKASVFAEALKDRFLVYEEIIRALQSYYSSTEFVRREQFTIFTSRILAKHSGIAALEWIPRITEDNRESMETRAFADGLSSFQITEKNAEGRMVPVAVRHEYYPVYYVEPLEGNEPALGFDLASNPIRRAALSKAVDEGVMTATPRINLVQEREEQFAFLLFQPIFKNGLPFDTVEQRRANVRGFVLGVYRVGDVVQEVSSRGAPENLILTIEDESAPPDEAELFSGSLVATEFNEDTDQDRGFDFEYSQTFPLGDREWRMTFSPDAALFANYQGWLSWGFLVVFLMFAALLEAFLLMVSGRTAQIEALIDRRTRELKNAEINLKRSNEELQQFAYVASHDLQEPLRMVSSYTQLLQRRYKGKLDADADEFIHYAVDGAARMQAMIQDLLSFSRLDTQGEQKADTSMQAALDAALINLQASVKETGAVVTADELGEVLGDQKQLTQLFQNLVGNAIKYRREDVAPRIHVSCEKQNSHLVYSITDNGIGIDEKYRDRIFVIFQRLHGTGEISGSGIGLAICKKIVERHAGRIWVEENPQGGSIFLFALPAPDAKTKIRRASREKSSNELMESESLA